MSMMVAHHCAWFQPAELDNLECFPQTVGNLGRLSMEGSVPQEGVQNTEG